MVTAEDLRTLVTHIFVEEASLREPGRSRMHNEPGRRATMN